MWLALTEWTLKIDLSDILAAYYRISCFYCLYMYELIFEEKTREHLIFHVFAYLCLTLYDCASFFNQIKVTNTKLPCEK